ncbi:MAG: hypothetical protein CVV12_13105 [Gammaproteobacteria bacterium HGW-Gammaproteobacteria-2]|nr:MAG: hypothetical protein CVV12_13105 [Gammaproteobacteria bacterium HGW-Gammaproteobacteria-2]
MKRFVLLAGVLSWGVPMFVVMTFFVHRANLSPKMLAAPALIWLMGGALFGVAMWLLAERQYRKATSA